MIDEDPGFEQPAGEQSPVGEPVPDEPSLTDDVMALIDDGKTYLEAEIEFQKTRAAFAFARGRSGAAYGAAAAALLHLALVALVVGSIFALAPMIGAWAATAIVVALLAVGGGVLALAAKRRFTRLTAAYRESRE